MNTAWRVLLGIIAPITTGLGIYYYLYFKCINSPREKANKLRNEGNYFFGKGKLQEALAAYTTCLAICPKAEPVLLAKAYQNRAATYDLLGNVEKVTSDCDQAIELVPFYVKALRRRARALEKTGKLKESLDDITLVCQLEKHSNPVSVNMHEEILQKLAKSVAAERLQCSNPAQLPSDNVIRTHRESFWNDPTLRSDPVKHETGDAPSDVRKYLRKAFEEKRYEDIIPICNDLLSTGTLTTDERYETLLFRGTVHLWTGSIDKAKEDLDEVINGSTERDDIIINALIKRALLTFGLESPELTVSYLDKAESLDKDNADIFFHRGQILLRFDRLEEAVENYENATKLAPDFPLGNFKYWHTRYKASLKHNDIEETELALQEMRMQAEKYMTSTGFILLGQLYADQGKFKLAQDSFDKALECDVLNSAAHVHKGLLELQCFRNYAKAAVLLEKALEIDPKCIFAIESLITLELQRQNWQRTIDYIEQIIPLLSSPNHIQQMCAMKAATEAQMRASLVISSTSSRLNITLQ